MHSTLRALRTVGRSLSRQRGFTSLAVLTLAIGISCATAMFSVVRQVILRPLPWAEPERLALIWRGDGDQGFGERLLASRRRPGFDHRASTLEAVGGFAYGGGNLSLAGGARAMNCVSYVSADLLSMLGTDVALGRAFAAADFAPGGGGVAILSDSLWQEAYGAEPAVVGRRIVFDGRSYEVVGVMPPGYKLPVDYTWPGNTELYVPLVREPSAPPPYGDSFLYTLGRLRAGATAEVVADELAALGGDAGDGDGNVSVLPIPRVVLGAVEPVLAALVGAVVLVLLVACANVASLLLARADGRRREMAIRGAMGADRRRLLRQLLGESLALALAGGTVALLLAHWGLGAALAPWLGRVPRLEGGVAVDGGVFVFALALSALTTLVFGLIPALEASRADLRSILAEADRSASTGPRRRRRREVLVVCEVAMAAALVVGAVLLLESLAHLARIDSGFSPERVLTGDLVLAPAGYPDLAAVGGFHARAAAALEALPEVERAAFSTAVPIWNAASATTRDELVVRGRPSSTEQPTPVAWEMVTPGLLETLGVALRAGRGFLPEDDANAAPVVIVNAALAKSLWGEENPLGEHVRLAAAGDWMEVVGVAADMRDLRLTIPPRPQIYLPHAQVPAARAEALRYMSLMLRTAGEPAAARGRVEATLRRLDPDLALANARPLGLHLRDSLWRFRFSTLLLGLFATIALGLAAVGLYGVLSFAVAARTHEIGIRLAVGADAAAVTRLVAGRGLRLAAVGLALGTAAAAAASRVLSSFLYGVTPRDPGSFLFAAALVLATAAGASYLPARRASRVDPAVALRDD